MIEDIDQEYLDYMEDTEQQPEAFFLFESSLKLLCKYLLKLKGWYNETIYLYYFQVLSLYYWYDLERTQDQIKATFASKINFSSPITTASTLLFTLDFTLSPLFDEIILPLSKIEDASTIELESTNPNSLDFVNSVQG